MRSGSVVTSFAMTLILALAACIGCASPESGKRTMKLHEWQEPHVARAPHTGKYDVAYRLAGTSELVHERYTNVSVKKGDPLGFRDDPTRGFVAVAGKKEFVLGQRNAVAEYYCWYHRPKVDWGLVAKDFERGTLQAVTGAVLVVSAAALVGGAVYVDAELSLLECKYGVSDDGSDWSDVDAPKPHSRHHQRKH
jgi:hypothetical protein